MRIRNSFERAMIESNIGFKKIDVDKKHLRNMLDGILTMYEQLYFGAYGNKIRCTVCNAVKGEDGRIKHDIKCQIPRLKEFSKFIEKYPTSLPTRRIRVYRLAAIFKLIRSYRKAYEGNLVQCRFCGYTGHTGEYSFHHARECPYGTSYFAVRDALDIEIREKLFDLF